MARGREGAFGGKTLLQAWYVWLGFCVVFLARARRPAPAALDAEPRPARPALVLRLAALLQPRGDLRERPARLPGPGATSSVAGCGSACADASRPLGSAWPTWAFAAAAVFLLGFRVGLNVEAPRGVIDVGLAGVVGASRILDGEAPYGNMPQHGELEPCGQEDADGFSPRAHPDERALRGGDRARRHVRPGLVPRLRAGGCSSSTGAGSGTRSPPRTRRRSRSTCSPSSGSCSSGSGSEAGASRPCSPSRGPRTRSRRTR